MPERSMVDVTLACKRTRWESYFSQRQRRSEMNDITPPVGLALCECGHSLSEHAESGWGLNTVCVEKLPTFPDGGWYGVCPCVRHGDEEDA
jgi:hypothetical protein